MQEAVVVEMNQSFRTPKEAAIALKRALVEADDATSEVFERTCTSATALVHDSRDAVEEITDRLNGWMDCVVEESRVEPSRFTTEPIDLEKIEAASTAAVTDAEYNAYVSTFPEFCEASIRRALGEVKRKHGNLDAITVDHHLKGREFGGLGMGLSQDEQNLADMGG